MKAQLVKGTTSYIAQVFIQDSTSTTGAGKTGLAFNTSSLTAYYHRDTDTTATAISLVTMTVGTFTSSGFKEIDATNMPGWYQLCPPNAALASGAKSCGIHLQGATGMAPLPLEIELTGWDNQDAVHGGMSAFPNVASGSAGALLVDGTGTAAVANSSGKVLLQATQSGVTIPTVTTVTNQLTAAAVATGIWQDATAGDFTAASSIGKSLYTTGNAPGAASGIALVGSNMGTASSVTGAVGSVTGAVGSVTGAVGSVTGAVGSVTGNVGGNVVGSVASVTAGVSVGSGGIQSTSFASAAIDAAAIATDAIGSAELAATAVTKIATGVFAFAFPAAYGSYTCQQILELIVASQAGKTSGAATTTFTIRNLADSADVIVATVDASGDRSAVTLTP